ncbi:MAG: hypothetical protein ACLGJB_17825 [Blastocatellia bacterium]
MHDFLIAVVSLVGGSFIPGLFKLKSKQIDDASSIREELLKRINSLDLKVENLTADLDSWKTKYYNLLEKYSTEKEEWKRKYFELQATRDREKDEYQDNLNQVQEKFNKANSDLEALRKICTLPTVESSPQTT